MSAPHIALSRDDVLFFRDILEDLPSEWSNAMRAWLANFGAPDVLHALFADQPLPLIVLHDPAGDPLLVRAPYHGAPWPDDAPLQERRG